MTQPLTLFPEHWQDYRLIDTGNGQKLEQFGHYTIIRPEAQATWQQDTTEPLWHQADAVFQKSGPDQGQWRVRKPLPESWLSHWRELPITTRLTPFKHTGIFPEQSSHWQWMSELLASPAITIAAEKTKPIAVIDGNDAREKTWSDSQPSQKSVLNLFAYTGVASIVCAQAGAKVTHVDSSRSAIGWAKKNQAAAGLDPFSIRWILEDVTKFVAREIKRGTKYDAIILDPPAYGHGPSGETWSFNASLPKLLTMCSQLLTPQPIFVLLNAYAVNISSSQTTTLVSTMMKPFCGTIEHGALLLKDERQHLLSTGVFSRWQSQLSPITEEKHG